MVWVPQLPQKYLAELRPYWRRRWVAILCAWGFALLGWIVVAVLPNRYEAMTRIYVETENLLTPLLRNIAVQADIQRQLEVLQRTLLNRNNMAKVAHATDLDLDAQTDLEKEQLYEALAKKVTVKAEGQNLFSVGFSNGNPQLAKKVVETLLNIFVETNLGQNRTSMESARTFLENQITEYETKLKQADQRLADYKTQHYDVLAATGANFMGRLDSSRQNMMAAKTKLENVMLMRDQIRAGLATTPQFLSVDSSPQVVINGAGGNTGGTARARVQQLKRELANLQSKFTDQHPDVTAAKRALESAEAELEADQNAPPATAAHAGDHGSVSNPVYEQLRVRLIQAEGEVAQETSQLKSIKEEVERLEGLAVTAPRIEADLTDLSRETGVLKAKYEELLGRRESARISEAVETSGDKVQFRIIEAPQVPAAPSFPNRPLFASLVLVAGIGFGCGVVFLLHKIDDTVGSGAAIAEEFNVRVLGSVSKVENPTRMAERRRSGKRFAIATGSLVGTYALVLALTQAQMFGEMMGKVHLPASVQRILDHAG